MSTRNKLKIQFIGIGFEQLSIGLLSAIAKEAGYEVSLAFNPALFDDRRALETPFLGRFFDETREVLSQIEKTQPHVLAFSPVTGTYRWQLDVARKAKEIYPEIKTIFGGPHVSAAPERAVNKSEVDFVVVGEGELVFLEILKHIEEGSKPEDSIPNTLYINSQGKIVRGPQMPFNQELDKLPFCDKIIWEDYIKVNEKYLIMVSRGCPHRCAFCFNTSFANLGGKSPGKYIRSRSVKHVIKELLWAKQRYKKIHCIDFYDDIFTLNKQWLEEFLERYKQEISLPFQCLVHANFFDEEIARRLSDAGCEWLGLGVQSVDEEYRKLYLQRHESLENIIKAIGLTKKYSIKLELDHMLTLPEEPPSAQEKALRLYAKYTPARIQTYWTHYLPGTAMLKNGLKEKLITKEQAESLYEGIDFSICFRSENNIKNQTLIKLHKRYEFIFKILPLLPSRIRQKINLKSIHCVPLFLISPISFLVDIISLRNNPRFIEYRNHYIFHLKRFFYERLSGKKLKAVSSESNLR